MKNLELQQKIERHLRSELNRIILEQTDDDVLYAINLGLISRKISVPIFSICMSIITGMTANIGYDILKPQIIEYIQSIGQVQEEECIQITKEEGLKMLLNVLDSNENLDHDQRCQIINIYTEVYY